ncbi:hypothetical protein DPEC_G00135310 [Dallia pectoralis]|uniref:Uncharacterized protein n=1 Tax=Dallia pectoralis TaxID=75939 RepID=A0ACC2GL34_DALPE|nr:hypothetical protein DPEC_G00135310 [Dallia pectoralis]
MAGKKKEVCLQTSVTNQEQWDEMLATKGLTVVDVYQQWCGPCRAVVSLLRKIKNELGDDLLHFATAEADRIDALEKYRGKCEPTFLFFAGGEMVSVLRGANAPLLQRMVLEELNREKIILEQGGERQVVNDDGLLEEEQVIEQNQSDEHIIDSTANKSYTVAIIKPDAVAHGKSSEIIMKIQNAGFEILAQEERTLTESEAKDFYNHKAGEACFQDLVQFMASGPSHILVVSQQERSADVIPAWREFIGPADIEEARKKKPESLRAQYGSETLFNALHGSDDSQQASRELAFFFPSFRTSSQAELPEKEGRMERTLALIHPDLVREQRDEMLCRIHEAGFTVSMQKELMLSEDQVRLFYKQHVDQDFFPALLQNMTSGPVLALALARMEAVDHWKSLLASKDITRAKEENPDCLQTQFIMAREEAEEKGEPQTHLNQLHGSANREEAEEKGEPQTHLNQLHGSANREEAEEKGEPQTHLNQLHGSANREEAEEEINFFFPKQQTLAVIKPDAMEDHKEEILGEICSRGFTITQLKELVLSRDLAEDFYSQHRDKPFYNQLVDFMCRGPCMLLVLTKENAVEEWRSMMGPTDPAQAQETAPGSLRARFATDILHNALHGSTSQHHAQEKIQFLFGDITSDLNSDGVFDSTLPEDSERTPEDSETPGGVEQATPSSEEGEMPDTSSVTPGEVI